MSKQEKAIKRLLSKPNDFTWSELITLMQALDFDLKTSSGSHRKFIHRQTQATHFISEPHPRSILKPYQVRDLISFLKETENLA